jgi:hypothetical protein
MGKVSFDSTSSIKGMIFQFLVALERCFEMQEGQSVYIERFGDVSVIGDEYAIQIESKYYKRDLSDLDENVWNTISNWMESSFPLEKFSSLVLLTTQKIGAKSKWIGWNEKSLSDRKSILTDIHLSFEQKRKKSSKLTTLMNTIFNPKNASRLEDVVKKISLDSLSIDGIKYFNKLRDVHGGHLPKIQRERYIHELYGYIINPHTVEKNWEISYDDFSRENTELSQKLQDNTTVFPSKIQLKDINANDYAESLFVHKIKEIEYEEVLSDAVSDYVHTAQMIMQEINISPTIKSSYQEYEDNLEYSYRTKYRNACRNCDENEIINKSQNLYDDITSSNDGTFHTYNTVPHYFHNGVMHILAEEKPEVVWKLKSKRNE